MTRLPADFLLSRVLYRDGLMLVVDKPAGITVHARPGERGRNEESLEDYFDTLRFGLPRSPALAHRLDRDTTGCLILGRHAKALRKLHKLFFQGKVDKTYWAICRGAPEKPSGTIDATLKKLNDKEGWRVVTAPDGQRAVTTYRTLATKDGFAFIEAKPKTGRTHQIRVHLASLGAPIIGDPLYGNLSAEDRARPMMLHARRVVIPISKNNEPVAVEAPAPATMQELIERLGSSA